MLWLYSIGVHMYSIFHLSLFAALTCGIENGRCEEECVTPVDSSDAVCICPINETLVDNEICLCKLIIYQILFCVQYSIIIAQLLYFTLYDEVYENATTFIHHPLYHLGAFELSCNNDAGFNSTIQWIFLPLDDDSEIVIIDQSFVTLNITVNGMIVPVTFQAITQSFSVVTLQVSQVIPGNFVCQSNDFSLLLRVVTGMQCLVNNATYGVCFGYAYAYVESVGISSTIFTTRTYATYMIICMLRWGATTRIITTLTSQSIWHAIF